MKEQEPTVDPTVAPRPTVRRPSRAAVVVAALGLAILFLASSFFLPGRRAEPRTTPPAAPPALSPNDPQRKIEDLLAAAQRERRRNERDANASIDWAAREALDAQLAQSLDPSLYPPREMEPEPYPRAEDADPPASLGSSSAAASSPEALQTSARASAVDRAARRLQEALDSPILASKADSRSKPDSVSAMFPELPPPPAGLLQLLGSAASSAAAPPAPSPAAVTPLPAEAYANARQLVPIAPAPPRTLERGSAIPATLTIPIDSDLPGSATALVSQDVYDTATGRDLLIPRGSRLFGRYDSNVEYGQGRLVLAWTLLTLPDGTRFDLGTQLSADASGAAGVADTVDRHLGRMYSSALLLSILSAGAQLSQPGGYGGLSNRNPTAPEVGAGALGQRLNDVSANLLEREIQVKPTLRIRPGTPLTVLVTNDIVFPP